MDELNTYQKEFVELLKTGADAIEAVKKVYDIQTDEYAEPKAMRLLGNDAIKRALRTASERIPDDLLEAVHLQGLTALTRDRTGNKVPDHTVRHKFLDSAYKLKGAYVAEKKNPDDPISLEVASEVLDVLKSFVQQNNIIEIDAVPTNEYSDNQL